MLHGVMPELNIYARLHANLIKQILITTTTLNGSSWLAWSFVLGSLVGLGIYCILFFNLNLKKKVIFKKLNLESMIILPPLPLFSMRYWYMWNVNSICEFLLSSSSHSGLLVLLAAIAASRKKAAFSAVGALSSLWFWSSNINKEMTN